MCETGLLCKPVSNWFKLCRVNSVLDPNLSINLAMDASAYGVEAVISYVFLDGSEQPVAFVSRTLHDSEKNYSQLDKAALSLDLV